jgi:hypothetical protein
MTRHAAALRRCFGPRLRNANVPHPTRPPPQRVAWSGFVLCSVALCCVGALFRRSVSWRYVVALCRGAVPCRGTVPLFCAVVLCRGVRPWRCAVPWCRAVVLCCGAVPWRCAAVSSRCAAVPDRLPTLSDPPCSGPRQAVFCFIDLLRAAPCSVEREEEGGKDDEIV